jgi:hypothetical protein
MKRGLTPSKSHKLQTYSRRSGSSTTRVTNVAAGGGTFPLNASGNSDLDAIASALPDTNGKLEIAVSKAAITQNTYLDALILSKNV